MPTSSCERPRTGGAVAQTLCQTILVECARARVCACVRVSVVEKTCISAFTWMCSLAATQGHSCACAFVPRRLRCSQSVLVCVSIDLSLLPPACAPLVRPIRLHGIVEQRMPKLALRLLQGTALNTRGRTVIRTHTSRKNPDIGSHSQIHTHNVHARTCTAPASQLTALARLLTASASPLTALARLLTATASPLTALARLLTASASPLTALARLLTAPASPLTALARLLCSGVGREQPVEPCEVLGQFLLRRGLVLAAGAAVHNVVCALCGCGRDAFLCSDVRVQLANPCVHWLDQRGGWCSGGRKPTESRRECVCAEPWGHVRAAESRRESVCAVSGDHVRRPCRQRDRSRRGAVAEWWIGSAAPYGAIARQGQTRSARGHT